MSYVPPFTVSAKAIKLIAEISSQIERYAIRLEQADALHLRKANRIKTIHSSLAIEGNTLTEGQVLDILNGKTVMAPLREIQEVKNAIRTYELYPELDPFSMDDLLRAHGVMMEALENPGRFRDCGVGVFKDGECVHMAPPASRVPQLMYDLFQWLRQSEDHLLIRSCVFHYEFEFIHPFVDGNGRTGRLWQSLILGKQHPLFEHLPVENMVYANQQRYYDAINASSDKGNSGPFIDFMLEEILQALKAHQGTPVSAEVPNKVPNRVPNKLRYHFPEFGETVWNIYMMLTENPHATALEIGEALGISDRMVRKHLASLKEVGLIVRHGSNKAGYWEVRK